MINSISIGNETLTVTSSTTLGYGPGQTAPPRLLLCNPSANMNVVLPTIPPVLPNPPGTVGTSPGTGDGLIITIRNLTSYAVTVTAGGSDTVFDAPMLTGAGATANLIASIGKGYWYNIVSPWGAAGIRSVGGTANTVATTDRYFCTPTAGTVTILAPTNYPVGVECITVINTSGSADTLTPASGTVVGVGASYTLATKTSAGLATDGTAWYLPHSA